MKSYQALKKLRSLRWLVYLLLLALLYFTVLSRFRYQRLAMDPFGAMAPAVKYGERHLIDLEPATALGRNWIVIWQDFEDAFRVARVAGLPGERMRNADGHWFLQGQGGEKHMLPRRLELDATWQRRLLGQDEYLLLSDHLELRAQDSRSVGLIHRRRIRARVLFRFGGGS